jgi:hypothetical protein
VVRVRATDVVDGLRDRLGADPADTPTGIACPRCGERDLWTYGLDRSVYRCRSCRFEGLGPDVFRAASAETEGWLDTAGGVVETFLPTSRALSREARRGLGALLLLVLAVAVVTQTGVL